MNDRVIDENKLTGMMPSAPLLKRNSPCCKDTVRRLGFPARQEAGVVLVVRGQV